ncbi:MAG: hypothetical protein IKO47_05040 [Ruminococcus sp.]|nr:hypothetical protein [Ruminococcus sp.]
MPAYFSIFIEFERRSLTQKTVGELAFYLRHAGLSFRDGLLAAAGMTENEIISRNQLLLDVDFEPDPEQEDDYFQSVYDLDGFTSVRGFFLNNYPKNGSFAYELLIPEDEIINEKGIVMRGPAERLLRFLMGVWHMPSVQTIQTATEMKGELVPASEFGKWKLPAANPYALVSEIQLRKLPEGYFDAQKFHVGGIILTNLNYIIM